MAKKQNITDNVNRMVGMGMVGIGLLLNSCSYLNNDEETVFSPRFIYQQREYSCTGIKNLADEYERVSVFGRDNPQVIAPAIHYRRDLSQIMVIDSNLDQQEASNLLSLCEEELKKQPYTISRSEKHD